MKSRDVVGKRIVSIENERMSGDPEYYGPQVVCCKIVLEDETVIVAHAAETTDVPFGYMDAHRQWKARK